MGIFSFGKNKADTTSRRGGATRAARSEERVAKNDDDDGEVRAARAARVAAARGRPGPKAGQEAMLDPTLPEKQRARRRLVGAVALVLAAVVILPMVLDARPKPVTDGIAISIPAQETAGAHASAKRRDAAADDDADASNPGEAAAPDAAPGTTELRGNAAANAVNTTTNSGKSGSAAATDRAVANADAIEQVVRAKNAAPKSPVSPPPKTVRQSPAASASVATAPPPTAPPAALSASPPTPATPGSHYVVQLGNFASEAAARDWVGKLKNIGVPAYIEHVKQADGTQRVMLRAGPFADRTVAQAAVLKVRQAGLSQAGH